MMFALLRPAPRAPAVVTARLMTRLTAVLMAVPMLVLMVALVAACGSAAPPRFHTLMPAAPATRSPAAAALPAWQLLPISIPAQVDQPQFVLRRADDTLAVLEQERWIAPLQDEIRAALTEHLGARLGAPGATPAEGRKDWRIGVDVQRFDSTPGRSTLITQWSLLGGAGTPPLRCRSAFEQPVGTGVAALAGGHRQALERLAGEIAPVLAALDAGQAAACSSPPK